LRPPCSTRDRPRLPRRRAVPRPTAFLPIFPIIEVDAVGGGRARRRWHGGVRGAPARDSLAGCDVDVHELAVSSTEIQGDTCRFLAQPVASAGLTTSRRCGAGMRADVVQDVLGARQRQVNCEEHGSFVPIGTHTEPSYPSSNPKRVSRSVLSGDLQTSPYMHVGPTCV
jgi:hypothetical protein